MNKQALTLHVGDGEKATASTNGGDVEIYITGQNIIQSAWAGSRGHVRMALTVEVGNDYWQSQGSQYGEIQCEAVGSRWGGTKVQDGGIALES